MFAPAKSPFADREPHTESPVVSWQPSLPFVWSLAIPNLQKGARFQYALARLAIVDIDCDVEDDRNRLTAIRSGFERRFLDRLHDCVIGAARNRLQEAGVTNLASLVDNSFDDHERNGHPLCCAFREIDLDSLRHNRRRYFATNPHDRLRWYGLRRRPGRRLKCSVALDGHVWLLTTRRRE